MGWKSVNTHLPFSIQGSQLNFVHLLRLSLLATILMNKVVRAKNSFVRLLVYIKLILYRLRGMYGGNSSSISPNGLKWYIF